MTEPGMSSGSAAGWPDPCLAEAIDEVVGRLQAGESVDLDRPDVERPGRSGPLRAPLPTPEGLAELGRSGEGFPRPRPGPAATGPLEEGGLLGGFRIVRAEAAIAPRRRIDLERAA